MQPDRNIFEDPRRAMNFGVGFSSPLWPTFFVAASAGVAYWAWTQWARSRAQSEFVGPDGQALTSELEAAAPPAASADTPVADLPLPATDPANDPETLKASAAAKTLDESLAVQAAAPEPEPFAEWAADIGKEALTPEPQPVVEAAPEPAPAADKLEPAHEPMVIEAVEPEPAAPVKTRRKAKTLASAATPEPAAPAPARTPAPRRPRKKV